MRNGINSPEEALVYMTECTMATIAHMGSLSSKIKGEFNRQISIAQTGIDALRAFHIVPKKGTRVHDVLFNKHATVSTWVDDLLSSPA